MSIKEVLVLGALAFPLLSYAQSKDSLTFMHDSTGMAPKKRSASCIVPYIIPVSLMSYGTAEAIVMNKGRMLLGLSSLLTAISVNGLKYTVREMRPNGSRRNSFPSGHTTVAFMGTELLWQEYKNTSPWIGIGGYVLAASTGALRVYNNKHWVGDVAFGAGLGILCTKLAYKLYKPISRKMHNKQLRQTTTVYPYYNGQQGGLALTIQL